MALVTDCFDYIIDWNPVKRLTDWHSPPGCVTIQY